MSKKQKVEAKHTEAKPSGGKKNNTDAAPSSEANWLENADHLQRTLGNRAIGRLLQTKMTVTAAGDRYEQEADAVASKVVERLQAPDPTSQAGPRNGVRRQVEEEDELQAKSLSSTISRLQRQEAEEEEMQMQRQEAEEEELQMQRQGAEEEVELQMQRQEAEEEELQAKSAPVGREGGAVDVATEQAIRQARGTGQRLPGDVRSPLERAFGADFSDVRVHTGSQSDQLNRAVSARAFTTGSDIFFRQGAYDPHSRSGQELLAHELTHVVQQGSAARRAAVQREDDEEQQEGAEGSDKATAQFKLKELSYRGFALFLRQVLGLNDPTAVASLSVSFTFNVGVSAGVANVLGASVGPYITLGGTINVADDRRLRVGASLEFGAQSELDIAKLWKIHAKIGMQLAIAGAFEDEKHLAAYVIAHIAKLLKGFKRLILGRARDRRKQLTREEIAAINQIGLPTGGEEGYDELSQKGVSVRANKIGVTSEVGTDIASAVKGKVNATGTRSTFYKNNAEGKRVKKVGHTTTTAFTLEFALPLSFGKMDFKVGITRNIITNDANPDNNGDYLNIKVETGFPFSAPLLEQALQNAPTILTGEDLEGGMKRFLRSMFDPVNIASVSGLLPTETPALEFNMVSREDPEAGKSFFKQLKDGDYFLQYARLSKNFSKEVKGKQEIPTGVPGLNVSLGQSLKFERSVGTGEVLGSRTLTYIQTVYNGLLNRGRRGENQWNQYRDAHKSQIYEMFIGVADPTSAAYAEASALDTSKLGNQLNTETLAKANAFVRICQLRFNEDKLATYDLTQESDRRRLKFQQKQVMPYFEAYLAAARAAGKQDDAKTWRLVRSGLVKAQVQDGQRPFKPQLTKLKFDKGVDDMDPQFPRTLREAHEEGFRNQLTFKGRHVSSGKYKTINVKYQQPDDPVQKFVQKIGSSNLRKFTRFPMGLTILDEEFHKHAEASQNKFDSVYQARVREGEHFNKAIKAAQKERQALWEKNLYRHLAEIMETTLDAELERKSSS